MARARVFLKEGGPLSKSIGSRKFEGRTAHIMTNDAEILAYKSNPQFFVEDLDGEPTAPPKSDPKASPKPSKGKSPKGKAPKGKPAKAEPEAEEPEDDDEEELDEPDLSDDTLRAKTKADLVELAKELGVKGVDVQQNKDDIIAKLRSAGKE